MNLIEKTKNGIKLINIEFLSLWYMLRDRRVPIYTKLLIFLPFGYILSPLDFIPDSLLFLGHIDDLAVFRFIFYFIKKIVKKNIVDDSKERAEQYFKGHDKRRGTIIIVISAIWIALFTLLCVYFVKKILKHKARAG
jgi:uncharacterized membrane protein YkvA (DUF1232 family)